MLSVISILALIAFTISTNTVNSLIYINPIFLFAAIVFQLLSWLVSGARVKTMSEAIGGEIPLKNSVTIVLSSLFAASIYSAFISTSILGVFIIAWKSVTYYLNILVGGLVSLKILKGTEVLEGAVGEVIEELE